MRVLIITVAGTATRFNIDSDKPVLKCIYYKENPQYSLLYQIFLKASVCDRIIVVGGFEYRNLVNYINTYLSTFTQKTEIIFNPHFEDYGSGYSLYLGIKAARKINADEIIFTEGDLYFSQYDFKNVIDNKNDVLTINSIPIESGKAVMFYENLSGYINYLYDPKHEELFIKEPFRSVYNSAQIWKFTNPIKLYNINEKINEYQNKANNLVIINRYFSDITRDKISIITMNNWINCNTIKDYDIMLQQIKMESLNNEKS
jgi:hypothetical protein